MGKDCVVSSITLRASFAPSVSWFPVGRKVDGSVNGIRWLWSCECLKKFRRAMLVFRRLDAFMRVLRVVCFGAGTNFRPF